MKLLYFSSVGWDWIHQRPHHLAMELASMGNDVIFLSFGKEKCVRKPLSEHLTVVQIKPLRGYMRFGVLRHLLKKPLSSFLKEEKFDGMILTNPVQFQLISKVRDNESILYDCMDFLPEFYGGSVRQKLIRWERELCQCADNVVASSSVIAAHLQGAYGLQTPPVVIRNAYDPNCIPSTTAPVEERSLSYMGTLDEKWFDHQSLLQFAKAHPDWTLHLIGPVAEGLRRKLVGHANLLLYGALPHREALERVAQTQVVTIPFHHNHLIDGVDPVKLYEYLALGKPVVTTQWESLAPFAAFENLHFYDTPEMFERQVLSCQGRRYQPPTNFPQEHSWNVRAQQMLAAFNLERRTH